MLDKVCSNLPSLLLITDGDGESEKELITDWNVLTAVTILEWIKPSSYTVCACNQDLLTSIGFTSLCGCKQ